MKTTDEVKAISKLVKIPLENLHFQYVPMACPEKFWSGYDMMALKTSPHVELLRYYAEHGFNWGVMKDMPYVRERQERLIVHGRKSWTDKFIKQHVRNRVEIYESLKKHGYSKNLGKKRPVLVLKEPFWKTRFGKVPKGIEGAEIMDGGGRCAAAYVLGWKEILGIWVKDKYPDLKKCIAITRKFKKWNS